MSCREWEGLLDAHELGLLTNEQTRALEEHALDCDACFESLFESSELSETFRERRREALDAHAAPHAARRRPWVAWAGVAAAALLATVAVVTLRQSPAPDETLRGGDGAAAVLAFSPRGLSPLPIELNWAPVPLAASYEVQVWTADGALVWRAEVAAPPARLPDDVTQRLLTGGTHAWQVHAVAADGERWESERLEFTVQP